MNIVFVHGWGMNRRIWDSFLPELSALLPLGISVDTIDLPGFGEQHGWRSQHLSLNDMQTYVEQILPKDSIVVAWSMGGLVSQRLLSSKCSNVIAQVQITSSPKFLSDTDWPGIKPDVLEMFAKQLEHDYDTLIKRFLAIQCVGVVQAKQALRDMYMAIKSLPDPSQSSLAAGLQILANTDLRCEANEDLAPSLRIFGALDSLVPEKAIPLIQALYPQDSIMVIDKASHAPFISHPQLCAKAIADFVNNLL